MIDATRASAEHAALDLSCRLILNMAVSSPDFAEPGAVGC